MTARSDSAQAPSLNGPSLWNEQGPVAAACRSLNLPYEVRDEQIALAGLIETALDRQSIQAVGILPLEADTGTGKTLAYLVPGALHAVAVNARMLVSTHTIALGVQILQNDGPIAQRLVETATGTRPRIAHMRGRRHFVSASRARAVGSLLRDDGQPKASWQTYLAIADDADRIAALAAEAIATSDGDLPQEVLDLVDAALLERLEEAADMPLERDEICLLASSPEPEHAVHQLSTRMANEATILVTTHAYTAKALARRSLFGSDQDPFDLLVVDEADQWSNAAASASLMSVSMADLRRCVEQLLGSLRHSRTSANIVQAGETALQAIDSLEALAPTTPGTTSIIADNDPAMRLLGLVQQQVEQIVLLAATHRNHAAAAADALRDKSDELRRIQRASLNNENDFWVPRWSTSRLRALPSITVSGRAPGRILKRLWTPHEDTTHLARTVVLTSATLTTPGFPDGARWKSIQIATGADPASGLVLTDLEASIQPRVFGRLQVRFADPRAPVPSVDANGDVDPAAVAYAAAVIRAAMQNSAERNGRTLVLVPSYDDVKRLAPLLPDALLHQPGERLQEVLEAYRKTKGCCLVTPGAWVGANLPGLVQNLVIPRIPYLPRDGDHDRFVQALSGTLAKLAQGIGRAIRRQSDNAVLWFADPRMPIPERLVETTGLFPSESANPVLLGAIPERFRKGFARLRNAAAIGVPYEPEPDSRGANPRASANTPGNAPRRTGKNAPATQSRHAKKAGTRR